MPSQVLSIKKQFITGSRELTLTQNLMLSFAAAALTGLMAQVKVALPFTPIPVTGQTFAVLLAGVILGKNWGGISQVIYATLGFAGIPWFNGMTGGLSVLTGATAGYIFGFILAAFVVGYVAEKHLLQKGFFYILALLFFAEFVLIYIPGLIHLGLWLHFVQGSTPSISKIIALGFLPFWLGSVIKTTLASSIAFGVLRIKK